jgi:hypothetical protein
MFRYGQNITWSTPTAPHPFSGTCKSYSARDGLTRQLIDDEVGDYLAAILHSRKVEINFEAEVTAASTDFLDLSTGPLITITGITPGKILASQVTEKWTLGQPKTASLQATHFPDITLGTDGTATETSAFTPSQTGLGIITPDAAIIYGTHGLAHAAGIVHGLTMDQRWNLTEDEPSPLGKIVGVSAHGYSRMIELEILATGAQPVVGAELVFTAAPENTADYRIESSETKFAEKRGKMYAVRAFWISPFSAGE